MCPCPSFPDSNLTACRNSARKMLGGRWFAPHIASIKSRGARGGDGRTTRHDGRAMRRRMRERIEEIFGWMKTVAESGKAASSASRRPSLRHIEAHLVGAAYSLLILARMQPTTGQAHPKRANGSEISHERAPGMWSRRHAGHVERKQRTQKSFYAPFLNGSPGQTATESNRGHAAPQTSPSIPSKCVPNT